MRLLRMEDVQKELADAERELANDPQAFRFWERIRIAPDTWDCAQYPGTSTVWVAAVLGYRCMYYNAVEGGWGWGRYRERGTIAEFHCQQDAIQHVIFQTITAILEGGDG